MRSKKRKLQITLVVVFLVLLVGLYAYLYLIPDISDSFTPTYIIGYGTMETAYDGRCIVVRNEKCVYSEHTGTVTSYVEESEKTRIGTRVADLYSGGEKYGLFCEDTGFVSYYYDGFEESLTPESVRTESPSTYLNINASPQSVTKENVTDGDFIYKLVDGDTWYIMLPVEQSQLPLFRIGGDLSLVLSDGTVLKANAERVVGDEELAIMARVLSYYPDFTKIRTLNVRIVTKKTKGLEIPLSSVAYLDDKPGVYVLGTDGEYHFTRIEILDTQNDKCLVTENQFTTYESDGSSRTILTVSLYDEILRDAAE